MANYTETIYKAINKGYSTYLENENGGTILYPSENQQLIELTMLQKWLRDSYKIFVIIELSASIHYFKPVIESEQKYRELEKVNNYELALLEGINEALQLI